MDNRPAIVVCAFNRPQALQRLLNALAAAVYGPVQVTLVVSIDNGGDPAVQHVAEQFGWPHGDKTVLMRETFLGLKEHILACGDLAQTYGSIVLLEDDLFVAPYFYEYACRALQYYAGHKRVAGVSLYNYEVAESCFQPFRALHDGNDVYFMQVASSWGQAWSAAQWQEFKAWYAQHPVIPDSGSVPEYVKKWGQHSWKKHFIHYLTATQRYFVFPRISFSTNFEEPGTNATGKKVFQSALAVQPAMQAFVDPAQSLARYDAWFEPEAVCLRQLNPDLNAFDFAVDFYATKQPNELTKPYVLSGNAGSAPLRNYSSDFFPLPNNAILALKGTSIGLYETKHLQFNTSPLRFRNLFTDDAEAVSNGVSAIVPYMGEDTALLSETLHSFLMQNLNRKELLIITTANHYAAVEAHVSYHAPLIRVLQCTNDAPLAERIFFGFGLAQNELLCWLRPGTLFSAAAFSTIEKIFTDFPNLSAVRGVPVPVGSADEQARCVTLPYRLTAAELYKHLEKDGQIPDTQLFFFSKVSINRLKTRDETMLDFLFGFLKSAHLHVVVFNFGRTTPMDQLTINSDERKKYLHKYSSEKRNMRLGSVVIDKLLRLPFFNDGAWQWYYTSLQGFPDVLRFDRINGSFFMSKF